MKLYPEVARRRTRAIATDAALVLAVVVFALLGNWVHDSVDELAGLGRGVQDAGESVREGFGSAADAVESAPLVGGRVAGGLRDAGGTTGGETIAAGRAGEESAHDLADLLGWLTFLIPTGLVLHRFLPGRVREVRAMSHAARVLGSSDDPERRRLLAMRAAFALPYGQLLAHTNDPIGDLAAGRYEPLVRAALEDAGLRSS
ncbi:MAG: hypothetical protein M3340_10390 [Actinomycetota bacterium]|nr:hypothetical protein [Actinomycetota bacterium]